MVTKTMPTIYIFKNYNKKQRSIRIVLIFFFSIFAAGTNSKYFFTYKILKT